MSDDFDRRLREHLGDLPLPVAPRTLHDAVDRLEAEPVAPPRPLLRGMPAALPVLIAAALLVAVLAWGSGGAGSGAAPSSSPPPTAAPASPKGSETAAALVPGCTLPALPFDVYDANDDGGKYGGTEIPINVPVTQGGRVVPSLSDSALGGYGLALPAHAPMGLPVAAILSRAGRTVGSESDPASVSIYYTDGPVGTWLDILGQPGAALTIGQTEGNDAQRVVDTIGKYATVIDVGPYKAAITHSSTYPNGMRIYALYWSDGTLDYALGVNASAAEAIQTAQSIYCR